MFRIDRDELKTRIRELLIGAHQYHSLDDVLDNWSHDSAQSNELNDLMTGYDSYGKARNFLKKRLETDPVYHVLIQHIDNQIERNNELIMSVIEFFIDSLYGEDDFEKDIGLRT